MDEPRSTSSTRPPSREASVPGPNATSVSTSIESVRLPNATGAPVPASEIATRRAPGPILPMGNSGMAGATATAATLGGGAL